MMELKRVRPETKTKVFFLIKLDCWQLTNILTDSATNRQVQNFTLLFNTYQSDYILHT